MDAPRQQKRRIVGQGAIQASCHDHISAVVFVMTMFAVLILASMYMGDRDLVPPAWMVQGPNGTLTNEVCDALGLRKICSEIRPPTND